MRAIYPTGRAIVLRGDARRLPLPDESVDLVVTSPPFLNLRSYTDGGVRMQDQIGTGTRDEFLQSLWDVTAEMVRVLKPTGSLFVELGDSYTNKCLNMTPHRYAIGCVDRLGLYKRAEIVWSRPNGLPESVTDRVRRSHSVVFHFVRQQRYYSAVDEVREPYDVGTAVRYALGWKKRAADAERKSTGYELGGNGDTDAGPTSLNPLGKLPGSVWQIPTAPLQVPAHLGVDHFAAWPPKLVERMILGWSPREVCQRCGNGRRPMSAAEYEHVNHTSHAKSRAGEALHASHRTQRNSAVMRNSVTITGYACACPDTTGPTRPGVVLDPFGGTGTSSLVASCYGRVGISVDLSHDYSRLARWRTTDPGERARVLGVDKPPQQVDGQLGMFDGEGVA